MPRGDGTGPSGMGPMTGRAAGYCAGYATPGCVNPAGGQGFGAFGRGRGGGGRGRRNRIYATGVPGWQRAAMAQPVYAAPFGPAQASEQELDALKGQAEYFEDALEGIKKRIEELGSEASEKAKE